MRSSCKLSIVVLRCRFYDAIITDPPYNVKQPVVASKSALADEDAGENAPVNAQHLDMNSTVSDVNGGQDRELDNPGTSDAAVGCGLEAIARAHELVGGVTRSLVSLAKYVLKPGGRLVLFLPLRGVAAHQPGLPEEGVDTLCGGCAADGEPLQLIFASKQCLKSPNMCRWLVVLGKKSP